MEDRPNPAGTKPDEIVEVRPPPVGDRRGLFHSLTLILIGASIGVFWREVFQLTIRAIEAFR